MEINRYISPICRKMLRRFIIINELNFMGWNGSMIFWSLWFEFVFTNNSPLFRSFFNTGFRNVILFLNIILAIHLLNQQILSTNHLSNKAFSPTILCNLLSLFCTIDFLYCMTTGNTHSHVIILFNIMNHNTPSTYLLMCIFPNNPYHDLSQEDHTFISETKFKIL